MKVFMFFITSGFCVEEACCFGEPGSWSSCDKSCEGGQRRRHKELFGINNDMVLAGSMWLATTREEVRLKHCKWKEVELLQACL